MADYYIKCINENSEGSITSVGLGKSVNKNISDTKSKERVIFDIDRLGKKVKTCYYSYTDSKYVEGDGVHTVKGEYLRTDGNDIESDNLEHLKECRDV